MIACDQNVETYPSFPDSEDETFLRVKLIREELKELEEAILYKDIVEVADALSDLLYVIYGAGHTFGIDLNKTFEEVHSSNMTKLGPDGKAMKNTYGKVIKGPNYREPNLKKVLFSQEK
jgi:predicted HAD superfamily Cof-like phosphohydrolase